MKKIAVVMAAVFLFCGFLGESEASWFPWFFGKGGGKGGSHGAAMHKDQVFSKESANANFAKLVVVSQKDSNTGNNPQTTSLEQGSFGSGVGEIAGVSLAIASSLAPEAIVPHAVQDGCQNERPVPVPEPATMILLGAGLLGLAAFSRRMIR